MKVSIEKSDKNQVKIGVNVEDEVFQSAILKSYKKNVSNFNIQGFRKGKVPFNYIKKVYGESVFYEDAVNFCIDDTYPEVIKENSIKPVDYPKIEIVEIGEGKGLEYNATVTVEPEVILGKYKNLEIEAVKYVVTDDEINKELNDMLEKNATIESKVSGAQLENKDLAIIDFIGYINDVPFEGGEGVDYSLEIGSKTFVDNFEDQLLGMKIGDVKDVFVTFPENYGKDELNGKKAKFVVTLKDIKIKIFPDLDDEFAKDVSEFDSLDELKNDIRRKLEDSNLEREKRETEDKLLEEVAENSEIDIPEVMINREIDSMIKDFESRLKYQGLTLSAYLDYTGITEEEMRNNMRETAIKRVKLFLVMNKISEVEQIEASEDEISTKANEIANAYSPTESQKLADMLVKTQRDSIVSDIKRNKVVDLLMQKSEI